VTQTTTARPIAEDLFVLRPDGEPVLVGSRCTACGTVAFPAQRSCARCTSEQVESYELASAGTLWTWTTQDFRPKTPPYTGPEEFSSYAVGYVELAGEIRVEGILTESDPERLRIGMLMRVVSHLVTAGGEPRLTFAFAPLECGDER
jgi:uncharacterized OB-fold protein